MNWMKGEWDKGAVSEARANYAKYDIQPVQRALPQHAQPFRSQKFTAVTQNSQAFVKHPYCKPQPAKQAPSFFKTGEAKFNAQTMYSDAFVHRVATPTKKAPTAYTSSIHTSGHKFVGESESRGQFVKHPYARQAPMDPNKTKTRGIEVPVADNRSWESESKASYLGRPNSGKRPLAQAAKPTLVVSKDKFGGKSEAHSNYMDWKSKPAEMIRPKIQSRALAAPETDDRHFETEAASNYVGFAGTKRQELFKPINARSIESRKFEGETTSKAAYTHHVGARPSERCKPVPAVDHSNTPEDRDWTSESKHSFVKFNAAMTKTAKAHVEYKRTADSRVFETESRAVLRNHGNAKREPFLPENRTHISGPREFFSETTSSAAYVQHPMERTISFKPKNVGRKVKEDRCFTSESKAHFQQHNLVGNRANIASQKNY